MDNLIVLDNITKFYKVPKRYEGRFRFIKNLTSPEYNKVVAVRDLSMLISRGERIGYIGPNGAGKSTTIKMLTGILMPTQGNISVFDRIPYKNRKFLSSQIGVVFGQKSQLWWDVPVIESYRLLKEIYRISDVQFRKNIDFYQTLFDIGDLLHTPVRQLSLGQRMRCDIVAALLHNPRILLLDEPTIGLDVNVKDKIRKFILKLNREKNLTVFLTTHDMKDVEELCKRIVLIDKGEKIFDGSIEAAKDKYITRRLLRVKFLNHIEISDLYNLLGTAQNAIEIRMMDDLYEFNFIQKTVSVSEVIRLLQSRYEVTDFSTVEPNIEDVIKKLC